MKTIKEWAVEVHDNAVLHGWWEVTYFPLTAEQCLAKHMLIVSEIAEATEEVRKGNDGTYFGPSGKPEGQAIELADAVIRIMDYCEFVGIDLEEAIRLKHEYNKTRPYRHGGKAA